MSDHIITLPGQRKAFVEAGAGGVFAMNLVAQIDGEYCELVSAQIKGQDVAFTFRAIAEVAPKDVLDRG